LEIGYLGAAGIKRGVSEVALLQELLVDSASSLFSRGERARYRRHEDGDFGRDVRVLLGPSGDWDRAVGNEGEVPILAQGLHPRVEALFKSFEEVVITRPYRRELRQLLEKVGPAGEVAVEESSEHLGVLEVALLFLEQEGGDSFLGERTVGEAGLKLLCK